VYTVVSRGFTQFLKTKSRVFIVIIYGSFLPNYYPLSGCNHYLHHCMKSFQLNCDVKYRCCIKSFQFRWCRQPWLLQEVFSVQMVSSMEKSSIYHRSLSPRCGAFSDSDSLFKVRSKDLAYHKVASVVWALSTFYGATLQMNVAICEPLNWQRMKFAGCVAG